MSRLWANVEKWGPGAVAVVTLLAALWYGRFIEGLVNGLRQQLAERTAVEVALRGEVEVWQAYVISLQKRMIEAGVQVPEAPRPAVQNHRTTGEREKR